MDDESGETRCFRKPHRNRVLPAGSVASDYNPVMWSLGKQ